MSDGPHASRSEGIAEHRGSHKRLAKIRMRGNFSIELWVLIVLVLLVFLVSLRNLP
jgi:hypothetical protein